MNRRSLHAFKFLCFFVKLFHALLDLDRDHSLRVRGSVAGVLHLLRWPREWEWSFTKAVDRDLIHEVQSGSLPDPPPLVDIAYLRSCRNMS